MRIHISAIVIGISSSHSLGVRALKEERWVVMASAVILIYVFAGLLSVRAYAHVDRQAESQM